MKFRLLLLVPLMIGSLQAASVDDLTFTLNDDGVSYRVSDCDAAATGEMIIPSTYSGLPVTEIRGLNEWDGAFSNCSSLTSITIPDSVSSIGNNAFSNCSSLTSITIPDSVTSIGNYAFYSCSSLTSVTIPNSVTSIGNNAFYECSSLTSITIPDSVTSIGEGAFSFCSSLTSITIPDSVSSIGYNAFRSTLLSFTEDTNSIKYIFSASGNTAYLIDGSSSTGSVTLPSTLFDASVKLISDRAFYNCSSLTSITIPDSVTSIGEGAFESCSSLISITIPDSVTSIGSSAFSSCSSLTSITIPDSVTSIGRYAFYNCSSLTSITIPDSVTSIGEGAFESCSSLTSITIPDSVTSIGAWAFYSCSSLTSITIPDSVTSIGAWAFYDCSSLTSITIPDSVTSIGNNAFYECSSLTSITIPDSVTSIGDSAFAICTSLTSITIPDSVTSIGDYAFYNCTSLTSITIPDSVTSIGSSAFSNCSGLTSINIPSSVTSIGQSAFGRDNNGGVNNSDSISIKTATLPYKFAGSAGLFGIPGDAEITVNFDDISEGLLANTNFVTGISEEVTFDSSAIEQAIADEALTRAEANTALEAYTDQAEADANAYTDQGDAALQQQITDLQAYIDAAVATARSEGVTAGIQAVTSDPQSYELYSESSILEMNVSNPTLSMLNEAQQAQVEFTLETSTNLEDWTIEERIQRTVQATEDQFFVRISSGAPYVTPTVVVFNHPSYGDILTDQSGNVLYGFSIDSAGGDPLYSGSAWPLASHSSDPEPDVDVSAALTSGTFSNTSGGPWLKINGRPVYTYVGDSEPNQASGHGLGSVWFTIKADGSLNQ